MSEESLHRINQILYLSGGASENLKLEGKDKNSIWMVYFYIFLQSLFYQVLYIWQIMIVSDSEWSAKREALRL